MWNFFLDLLFPRRSLRGESGEWITSSERGLLKIDPVIEERDQLRSREVQYLDRIVAACQYDRKALIHRAIHTFKYRRIPELCKDLGQMIVQAVKHADVPEDCVLCPVPLHWSRQFQRGFNQAALLGTVVRDDMHIPMQSLLKRTRATGHQAWRNRAERLEAMQGSFVFRGKIIPKCVVLIDDLATTGATLDHCAKVLKDAGVQRVEGWVVAHG